MGWQGEWSKGMCELCHQDTDILKVTTVKVFVEMFSNSGNNYLMLCNECIPQFLSSVVEIRKYL